jgi:hypothetical protein
VACTSAFALAGGLRCRLGQRVLRQHCGCPLVDWGCGWREAHLHAECVACRTRHCLECPEDGTLPGSFGEILGGKPVRVFLCHRPVSSIHPSNELMRRCLLRWEYETPRRAFCRIWQRFLRGSFKDRILLANLLQSSRSTFSRGSFSSFFAFQAGMMDTHISALGGWPTVSDRFRRHLTTHCEVRRNSLTPKISRLLPGSEIQLS